MSASQKTVRRKSPARPLVENRPIASNPEPLKRSNRESSSSPAAVAVLVILVLIAVGSYFAYVYFSGQSADEAATKQAVADEQAEAAADAAKETPADPAADWLSFALPAQGTSTPASTTLSFKYPKELQLTQNAGNLILSSDQVPNTQVNIYWVKSSKTLKEYLAAMDKINATGWEGKPSIAVTTSTEAVVISGYPAIFRQQKLLAADLNQYVTFVKAEDVVYSFGLAAPELDQNMLAFFVTFLNNLKLTK